MKQKWKSIIQSVIHLIVIAHNLLKHLLCIPRIKHLFRIYYLPITWGIYLNLVFLLLFTVQSNNQCIYFFSNKIKLFCVRLKRYCKQIRNFFYKVCIFTSTYDRLRKIHLRSFSEGFISDQIDSWELLMWKM